MLRHDPVAIVWLFQHIKQVAQEFGKTGKNMKKDLQVQTQDLV